MTTSIPSINIQSSYKASARNSSYHQTLDVTGLNLRSLKNIITVMMRRKEDRINCAHPMRLGDTTGMTRNISASGIYFVSHSFYMPGNQINFTVELDSLGGKLLLMCDGPVTRIEPRDGLVGVAVKILQSVIMPSPVEL